MSSTSRQEPRRRCAISAKWTIRPPMCAKPTGARSARLPRSPKSSLAGRKLDQAYLLSPVDLQAVKASGVTFVVSLLERVIEEQARGNPDKAAGIRADIAELIGDRSFEARARFGYRPWQVKQKLISNGAWSAVSRGRDRPRCRDLHQVPADVLGRLRRGRRCARDLGVEQSGA